jgi:hypothetical protein
VYRVSEEKKGSHSVELALITMPRLTLHIVQYRLLLPDVRTLLQFMWKKAKHENNHNKYILYFELLYTTYNYK